MPSVLFSAQAYGRWHHTFGHNVFLWGLFRRLESHSNFAQNGALLSFLSFGSHLLTDAQFSGWPLQTILAFFQSRVFFRARSA